MGDPAAPGSVPDHRKTLSGLNRNRICLRGDRPGAKFSAVHCFAEKADRRSQYRDDHRCSSGSLLLNNLPANTINSCNSMCPIRNRDGQCRYDAGRRWLSDVRMARFSRANCYFGS